MRGKSRPVDREEYFRAVYGRKARSKATGLRQMDSAKEDERAAYFKAVHGRKRRKAKAGEELGEEQGEESDGGTTEAVDVIPEAEAKALESVGGRVGGGRRRSGRGGVREVVLSEGKGLGRGERW